MGRPVSRHLPDWVAVWPGALVGRANGQPGTAEIWQAFAQAPLSQVTVAASLAQPNQAMLQVTAFKGAAAAPGASIARSACRVPPR